MNLLMKTPMMYHFKVILLSSEEVDKNINRLYQLHDKYGKDTSFEFKKAQRIFVVKIADYIVALAVFCQPHGFCWLRNFIVDEKYRGNHYQQALILEMLKYAKSKGIKKVTTAVDQMNIWSLNNFISTGFKFVPKGFNHNGHLYQKLQIILI
jgi:ribosomal protein S18 acetylase RimI-like enzyme